MPSRVNRDSAKAKEPFRNWIHIRDPKLHQSRTRGTKNESRQPDEHGSDSRVLSNSCDELEPEGYSFVVANQKRAKDYDDNGCDFEPGTSPQIYSNLPINQLHEIMEANSPGSDKFGRKTLIGSESYGEENLAAFDEGTIWTNERGEVYRLLSPKNDLQGNELRSAHRKLMRTTSVSNEEEAANDSGWKSDSELVCNGGRERRVTFSSRPPEVNPIPSLASNKKRTKSIKRKIQKITKDLENTIRFSLEVSFNQCFCTIDLHLAQIKTMFFSKIVICYMMNDFSE